MMSNWGIINPTVAFSQPTSQGSESVNEANIKVELSGPSSRTVTVGYRTSNQTAQDIDEGTGQDYTPVSGNLIFNPGETEKNITLNINNDEINEIDETILVTLSNPSNANLGNNTTHTYTIEDDDRGLIVSVADYGAIPDDEVEDTEAIQAAVDDVYDKGGGSTGAGGVIVFPEGTYIVVSVSVKDNITYQGYGAIIKKPDYLTEKIGQAKARWIETFTNGPGYYSSDIDSKPIVFKGLTFDGSSATQGNYKNYELEHAPMLFLNVKKGKSGRLKAYVEDCYFYDGVADAIATHRGVDIKVYNSTARDVFRGGFVSSGSNNSNNRSSLKNFTTYGDENRTGFDFESYNTDGTKPVNIYLDDIYLKDGDFDLGVAPGANVQGSNIFTNAPFSLGSKGSVVRFRDSRFKLNNSAIFFPYDVVFDNCELIATEENLAEEDREITAGGRIIWSTYYWTTENGKITYKNCRFNVDESVDEADDVYGITTSAARVVINDKLYFEDSIFSDKLDIGIWKGGSWNIKNSVFESKLPLLSNGYSGGGKNRWFNIQLENNIFKGGAYANIVGYKSTTENKLENRNIQIDELNNVIESAHGIEGNTYIGSRLILGENPPVSSTHCLINDIYRLKTPVSGEPHEWKCIDPGYSTNPSSWEALPTLSAIAYLSDYPQNLVEDNNLVLAPTGTNIVKYKYKLDDGSWSAERTISDKINLENLSNGSHIISIIGKNSSGEWQPEDRATTYTWLMRKDTTPPAGLVRINMGDIITKNPEVTLTFETTDANNVTEMKISNTNDFNSATSYAYESSKSWMLNAEKGIRSVYVWFKDEKGNWTAKDQPKTDTIYLNY